MAEETKDKVEGKAEEAEAVEEVAEETPEEETEAAEETSDEGANEDAEEGAEEASDGDDEATEETSDEPEEVVEEAAAEEEVAEETPAPAASAPVDETPSESVPVGTGDGLAAFFQHPNEIMDAAEHVRDKKFEKWDVFTPFPIHGMDDAMGIGRSWLPWVTFGAALTGMSTALTIQFGTMFFDWQIIIGGKPFFAWPSFMPITFELSVLFAGITTALVMFWAAGLPSLNPKIIDKRITRDRFVIWISSEDPNYDPVKTRAFLEGLGPMEVREVRFDT